MGVVENLWRRETPGHAGWSRSARPGADDKYFIVSTDTHINEPGEREMGGLTEAQRSAILGGNAVRCFGLDDLAGRRLAPAQKVPA